MEHTRHTAPAASRTDLPAAPPAQAKTNQEQRKLALEAAMEIAKTNDFNDPLSWMLIAADSFAKFLADGTVTEDPFGLEKTAKDNERQ